MFGDLVDAGGAQVDWSLLLNQGPQMVLSVHESIHIDHMGPSSGAYCMWSGIPPVF
jgi:hypothetical protein